MKTQFFTLTVDNQNGMDTSVHATHRHAFEALLKEELTSRDKRKAALANYDRSPDDYSEIANDAGILINFNITEHEIDSVLPKTVKVKLFTLATDGEDGTESSIHLTERAALLCLVEKRVDDKTVQGTIMGEYDADRSVLGDLLSEDDRIADHLDTQNIDEEEIEIPLKDGKFDHAENRLWEVLEKKLRAGAVFKFDPLHRDVAMLDVTGKAIGLGASVKECVAEALKLEE